MFDKPLDMSLKSKSFSTMGVTNLGHLLLALKGLCPQKIRKEHLEIWASNVKIRFEFVF
jgi:hypothetical protein